jgi:hypothetical protein
MKAKSFYPPMSEGEKQIWAAVYAIEFSRWTADDRTQPVSNSTFQRETRAGRIAMAQAALAVVAARDAIEKLDGMATRTIFTFASQMVSMSIGKKRPRTARDRS